MDKRVLYLALALVLFLIFTNPSGSGETGNEFVQWVGSGFDPTVEFLDSLFSGADDDG